MKVKLLDRKRADYRKQAWEDYQLLYEGGEAIEKHAGRFLKRNPLEKPSLYRMRLEVFHYKNIVGAIVDDIASTVFQAPLDMSRTKEGDTRPPLDAFYSEEFFPNPTSSGECTWNELHFELLVWAMVKREAYFFLGFPEEEMPGYQPASLAEQEARGSNRAIVQRLEPEVVINRTRDQYGLASAMLRHRIQPQELLQDDTAAKDRIVWTYLTRKTVRRWQIEVERGAEPKEDDEATEIAPETEHRFSRFGENERGHLPLACLELPSGLWLLDKVGSLAKDELRRRNLLGWYESQCIPQPYHAGEEALKELGEDKDANQAKGVAYFWEIGQEDTLAYLELSGETLPHLKDRLDQSERDIFKIVQNMAAAQGPGAAAQMQSAASKVRDSVAKRILCERFAKDVRKFATHVASLISHARSEADYRWEATGVDRHDIGDDEGIGETALKAQGITDLRWSPTFVKEMAKRTARGFLPHVPTETIDQIETELDAMNVKDPEQQMKDELLGLTGGGEQ